MPLWGDCRQVLLAGLGIKLGTLSAFPTGFPEASSRPSRNELFTLVEPRLLLARTWFQSYNL